MAIAPLEYRLWEWFNSQFRRVKNSQIVSSPYSLGYEDAYFFVKKRPWVENIVDIEWDVFDLAEYTDNNKTEYFASVIDWGDIKVYNVDFTTSTATLLLTKVKWNNFNFHNIIWPWWTLKATWTATGVTPTTLVDSTKSWTTNAFAGNFVYINSWTWIWQYRYIIWNTSNTLTVSWRDAEPSWAWYIIYEELTDNLLISTYDECYRYDWTSRTKSPLDNYDSIVTWKSRTFYLRDWVIIYSWLSWPLYFTANDIPIWDKTAFKLEPVWDYLIVWTPKKMYVIKEVVDSQWNSSFFSSDFISKMWLAPWDTLNWEKWIYFISNDWLLYSVSVQISWDNIIADIEPQHKWITEMLSGFHWDINIYRDRLEMRIFDSSTNTKELIFNSTYKWRLENEYKTKINKILYIWWDRYVCWDWYVWRFWWYKDVWVAYKQEIDFLVGNDSIFLYKTVKYLKFLFWKTDIKQRGNVTFKRDVWGKKYNTPPISLNNTEYFSAIVDTVWEEMWTQIMWTSLMWWRNLLKENLADVETMKAPIAVTCTLFNVILSSEDDWWLLFGWAFVYMFTHNINQNTLKNTI